MTSNTARQWTEGIFAFAIALTLVFSTFPFASSAEEEAPAPVVDTVLTTVVGCMDVTALNYDASATEAGECTYPVVEETVEQPAALMSAPEVKMGECDVEGHGDLECDTDDTNGAITVIASKVVCDAEQYLPNWGKGNVVTQITANTAADFVAASNGKCHMQSGWFFQWEAENAPDEGNDFVGESPRYTTFYLPTGIDGTVEVTIPLFDWIGSEIHLREVLQSGYIPFSFDGDNDNNVSAEFYCANDVLNYDNFDFIRNPQAGQTYYCAAFNALKEVQVTDMCSNLEGIQEVVPPGYIESDGRCIEDENGGGSEDDAYRIQGFVWNDANQNDENDEEPYLGGWTVSITNGTTTMSTTSDATGFYFFDVPAGTWTITETVQGGWALTYPNSGSHIVTVPAVMTQAQPSFLARLFVNTAEAATLGVFGPFDFGNVVQSSNGGGGSSSTSGGGGNGKKISLGGGSADSAGEVQGDSDTTTPKGEVLGAVAPTGAPNTGMGGTATNTTFAVLLSLVGLILGALGVRRTV